jgi:hypothetical protein
MVNHKLFCRLLVTGLFVLGFTISGLVLSADLSYGQSLGWSSPEMISGKGETSWFPDVVADLAGTAHIVWSSGLLDYDMVFHTAYLSDGTKLEPIEIRALYKTGGEVTRPTLLADDRGILHMSFRDTHVYYSQVNASQAHSAKYWSPDNDISQGYFSEMAIDTKHRIHYLFTRNVTSGACLVCYHVFYVWSDDEGATWSEEVDISKGPLGAAKPQIIIDDDDNLHVVWEAGIGGGYGQLSDTDPTDVMYVSSNDNGTTWGSPLQLNPSDMIAKNIAIQRDGGGQLIVVWWDINDDSIYYQTSANLGKSWSLPSRLPGVLGIWSEYHSRLDDYSMDVDSSGNVHLVFVGRFDDNPVATVEATNENEKARPIPTRTPTFTPTPRFTPTTSPDEGKTRMGVFHMVWNKYAWDNAEALASYIGDVAEWPRIAVGLGNQLHVVWFVRAEKDIWKGGGDYSVYYSTKTVKSPHYTPAAYPTIVPMATENLIQPVLETPTITPVMDVPENVQVKTGQLVYKEMDYLSVAAFSTLPVVIIVVVFFIVSRKLRR